MDYSQYWLKPWDMEQILAAYHDGVPISDLEERAKRFCDRLFRDAQFKAKDWVLEFGVGVGYIAEEFLRRYNVDRLVGLGISENTIEKARTRFTHPKLEYASYDGKTIPFPDESFDVVYSCDTVHHIEEHIMFHLYSEMIRVLKTGGRVLLHVLDWHDAPNVKKENASGYLDWCREIIRGDAVHWIVFHSKEEIEIGLGKVLKVADLKVEPFWPDGAAHRVTFGKKRDGSPGIRRC